MLWSGSQISIMDIVGVHTCRLVSFHFRSREFLFNELVLYLWLNDQPSLETTMARDTMHLVGALTSWLFSAGAVSFILHSTRLLLLFNLALVQASVGYHSLQGVIGTRCEAIIRVIARQKLHERTLVGRRSG